MAGIYIHIPFCRQACHYCNFHFSTSLASKEAMIQSLINEIRIRSIFEPGNPAIIEPGEELRTIYFGGGTPSLLSITEVKNIISAIYKGYTVIPRAEISLEANPDDITLKKAIEWKSAGINRLSIGVQSFSERDLQWMNRAHDSIQALQSIRFARQAGIKNFSIDLIFGVPGLSNREWIKNVQAVIDLEVPHIACYALTVEPKTALFKMIELKKKENIDSDIQAEQYFILMEMMITAGYEHYEISNFAKPGFRSLHNSSYWKGEKYIGIGPSAHSYDGENRMWNVANNALYIKSLQNNIIPLEKEILTPDQKLEEYIMIALRTSEGLDLQYVEDNYSLEERKRLEVIIEKEKDENTLSKQGDYIVLTNKGKLLADAITVKMFK